MKTVTITNDYHNSRANVRVNASGETMLTRSTVLRVRRKLCGISGCMCGGVLGQRGNQTVEISAMADGEAMIRPLDL